MEKTATISDDGLYRYTLSRRWSRERAFATFVMLNPSTADGEFDDPTIRRCVGFAKDWDMGGLCVVNLYAFRSTDPKALWKVDDPVGPKNDQYLTAYALEASSSGYPLVAAWGAGGMARRIEHVRSLPGMEALTCLGVTKAGQPRHPLYLKSDSERRPWPEVA